MKRKERRRDVFQAPPGPEYWSEKAKEGWQLIAIEWEQVDERECADAPWIEDIPYGLKVAEDCLHLVENPAEKDALTLMLEMLVADKPFSEVAECLNARGFRTRLGARWSQVDVFDLLPRLVEVASRIYPTHDWSERRKRIYKLAR